MKASKQFHPLSNSMQFGCCSIPNLPNVNRSMVNKLTKTKKKKQINPTPNAILFLVIISSNCYERNKIPQTMQITMDIESLYKLIPKSHGNSLIAVPIQSNHTSRNKTTITHIAEIRQTKRTTTNCQTHTN
jgi:hypothetical protein